jgi:hypothetical protein
MFFPTTNHLPGGAPPVKMLKMDDQIDWFGTLEEKCPHCGCDCINNECLVDEKDMGRLPMSPADCRECGSFSSVDSVIVHRPHCSQFKHVCRDKGVNTFMMVSGNQSECGICNPHKVEG